MKLYEHEHLYQARRDAADELYEVLSDIMENPAFATAIGGNPTMVGELMARASRALAKARGATA